MRLKKKDKIRVLEIFGKEFTLGKLWFIYRSNQLIASTLQFFFVVLTYILIACDKGDARLIYGGLFMILFFLPVMSYIHIKYIVPQEQKYVFDKNPEFCKLRELVEENNRLLKKKGGR